MLWRDKPPAALHRAVLSVIPNTSSERVTEYDVCYDRQNDLSDVNDVRQ